jgi:hypothetical protein
MSPTQPRYLSRVRAVLEGSLPVVCGDDDAGELARRARVSVRQARRALRILAASGDVLDSEHRGQHTYVMPGGSRA